MSRLVWNSEVHYNVSANVPNLGIHKCSKNLAATSKF